MRAALLVVLAACGHAASAPPIEHAATTSPCEQAIRAMVLPGELESVAIATVAFDVPDDNHAFELRCGGTESDDDCLARARAAALAAHRGATVSTADLAGDPGGWDGVLEVDGVLTRIHAPDNAGLLAEATRLQADGHEVKLVEGERVLARVGRVAIVQVSVASHTDQRLEAHLRWNVDDDATAIAALSGEAARRGLTVQSQTRVAAGVFDATLECPR